MFLGQNNQKSNKEVLDLRKRVEDLLSRNGDLSRANSDLRKKVTDLDFELKDKKEKLNNERQRSEHLQKVRNKQDETIKGIEVCLMTKQDGSLNKMFLCNTQSHYCM